MKLRCFFPVLLVVSISACGGGSSSSSSTSSTSANPSFNAATYQVPSSIASVPDQAR